MSRFRCRQRRDTGLPYKGDTPVKTSLSRRDKCRRLLPSKHYEVLSEEPEMEENNTSMEPGHCKSVLHSGPAIIINPRGKAVLPSAVPTDRKSSHQASLAGRPTIQMTSDTETFKGGEMSVEKEEQNLAVTPESSTSSCMESDTTFTSDEYEEDCYSSASPDSCSLPSPEIFRKENSVEKWTFPIKEGLLDVDRHIKNSTLLDASHAVSIHMHQPPNLSNIIDASAILPENNCEINQQKRPEQETEIHTGSFKSDKAVKWTTPPKVINKRPILCKKKVRFQSPLMVENFKMKHTPATNLTRSNASEQVQTSSRVEPMKPDTDISKECEMNSEEEALQLKVRPKRPVQIKMEEAKFFYFIDDSDRDAFFQRMRERCMKLRSVPLFPLTTANTKKRPVL